MYRVCLDETVSIRRMIESEANTYSARNECDPQKCRHTYLHKHTVVCFMGRCLHEGGDQDSSCASGHQRGHRQTVALPGLSDKHDTAAPYPV